MNPGRIIASVFVLLSCIIFCVAQDRGTITGIITDPTGAVVPSATITAKNPATGLSQNAPSGDDGTYTVPYLPVGIYTVTAELPGFRTAQVTNVRVSVNTTVRIDLRLEVGEVQEIFQVAASAPLLQTERSDLGKVFNSKAILDLPLALSNGLRNNLQFVVLTPGVTATPGNNLSLRIGGGLSAGHSMLLDGAEAASERRNDPSFQAVSTDAIEEFKVLTNNYSAEYGRTANGIINFTTKSGTNKLHASLFEFFRNDKLNARGFFPKTRQVLRQNIFGGTVGGPVYIPRLFDGRNRAFFFVAYEKSIYRAGSPSALISIPPEALRRGDFREWKDRQGNLIPIYDPATTRIVGGKILRDQFSCNGELNVICADRIHPVAAKLNSLLPPTEFPGLFNNIRAVDRIGQDQNVISFKGDYIFSEKSRLNGLFSRQFFGGPERIGPIPGPLGENFSAFGVNRFYRLNHDYVFGPNLLNHFTFGRNERDISEAHPNRLSPEDRQFIQLKGATGDSKAASRYVLGEGYQNLNFWVNTFSPSGTWSLNEQVAWVKGRHSLKFGFNFIRQDYRRIDCNGCAGEAAFGRGVTGLAGAAGQTGSSYASFLLGLPSSGFYNFGGDFSFGQPYYAWYVLDDFKVNPKLTVNLGLRYEIPVPKSEKHGKNSNLCLTCPNPAAGGILGALEFAGEGPGRTGKKRFTETRLNAWGPRLGIAYQLMPKTVLRAGGGIYYVPMREGANADRGVTGFGGNFTITSPDGGVSPAFALDQGFPLARKTTHH